VGQYYLLTTATHERRRIFAWPGAAEIVLDSLHWLATNNVIVLEAAVVMPDHLHFVAGLLSGTLSDVMRRLKTFTSKEIKLLLGHGEPVWGAQYHDHAIRKDEVLREVILYCLNNPVRAGLVKDFQEYPYWYCRFEV
jgi:REP element-mobilizing transposase RayT